MFRAEKTMFDVAWRPTPGDVSQAARILGKNNVWPKNSKVPTRTYLECHFYILYEEFQ